MLAKDYIELLELLPHPEGGYYKETYRSAEKISGNEMSGNFPQGRSYATAIYFLLEQGDYSAFHRIRSDECWHFYAGGPLLVHMIEKDGKYKVITIGTEMRRGQVPQFVVPANTWFASEPANGTAFSLVGCTVSPGFDFQDFEMANAGELTAALPGLANSIRRLCR